MSIFICHPVIFRTVLAITDYPNRIMMPLKHVLQTGLTRTYQPTVDEAALPPRTSFRAVSFQTV
jgi:predicted ribosome quality control (RQC) complex YloA/Tae2 family protein